MYRVPAAAGTAEPAIFLQRGRKRVENIGLKCLKTFVIIPFRDSKDFYPARKLEPKAASQWSGSGSPDWALG